ncbi:MAG: nickel-dependent hydrogenase large subunit [Sedimenticola sp.]
MSRVELNIDLNRVEGDLEFGLTLEDNLVVEARTRGTLYRGFEQIMIGRDPRDALVITPRICGICGTAHLYSAVLALEHAWGIVAPPNATRIRNLCHMAEGIQNDLRQTFLFFTPDFCNERYRDAPLYQEMLEAFAPFKGTLHRETLKVTRDVVGMVAIFGGQWPHSSYMMPGGVTNPANSRRIYECLSILDETQAWYEQRVIGDTLDNWLAMDSADVLNEWLGTPRREASGLGLMTRFARQLGLDRLGIGTPHMLSYGAWGDPEQGAAPYVSHLVGSGHYDGDKGAAEALDQALINEHVRYSWFRPYEGGKHPWQGETIPDYLPGDDRYTWAKAPRYGEKVVQTGPLAEMLIGGDALIADLYRRDGGSAWLRQFARLRRAGVQLHYARQMLNELSSHLDEPHFTAPKEAGDGQGYGLVMAARGALGHWLEISNGVISRYQIITPTAWNASPRDSEGRPGHWEQSLVGLEVKDPDNPVEIGHIIRSHDPCLVCTVHMLDSGRRMRFSP